jgi:HD-like signal output (HDOD) protein
MFWKGLSDRIALATGNFAKLFGNSEIPPLPAVATRLMAICRAEECDISEVGNLIASDLGISTRILRTVNSAHYGLRNRVTNIHQAIALLGIKRISSLVTAFAVARRLPNEAPGFDRVQFWQRSIQRSIFAQQLARTIAPGTEPEAFTGALLQDMALPVLLERWAQHYYRVIKFAEVYGRPVQEVENEQLSWNHTQAGAWMARNWSLPDELVCCIGLHHASLQQINSLGFLQSPVTAVAISARLPDAKQLCNESLRMSNRQYWELCEETDAACEELASVFQVPAPEPLAKTGTVAR